VPRREFYALGRNQIGVWIVRRRRGPMHRVEDAFVLLGPSDRKHAGMGHSDLFRLCTHAAGNDNFAVLGHCRFDGG